MKRTALARPFLSTATFAGVMPTASANSATDILRRSTVALRSKPRMTIISNAKAGLHHVTASNSDLHGLDRDVPVGRTEHGQVVVVTGDDDTAARLHRECDDMGVDDHRRSRASGFCLRLESGPASALSASASRTTTRDTTVQPVQACVLDGICGQRPVLLVE